MSHEHSSEEDFMNEVSFDLEDETSNRHQHSTTPKENLKDAPQTFQEQSTIKKPVTKISLNLKAKLMRETTENNKDADRFQDANAKMHDSLPKGTNLKENNEEILVPDFLLTCKASGGEASTSAIMKQVFPNRYFILKKLTKTQLEICMDSNYCVISLSFKKKIHDAYQNAENVYLIFCNTDAKQFLGYARMISEPENFEYLPDNLLELLSAECSASTHFVVRVEKQANNLVPFEFTKDFRNEFNNKSPVHYCKECQEVDKETAQKLCKLLDKPPLPLEQGDSDQTTVKNNEDLPLPPQLSSSHNNQSSPSHLPHPRQVQRGMNPGFPGPPGFMMPPPFYPSYMFPTGDFSGGFPPLFPMDYNIMPFGKPPQNQTPSLLNHLGLFSMPGSEQIIGSLGFNPLNASNSGKKNKDSKSSDEKDDSNSEENHIPQRKKKYKSRNSSSNSQKSRRRKRSRHRSRSRSHHKDKKRNSGSERRKKMSKSKDKTRGNSKKSREKRKDKEKEREREKEKEREREREKEKEREKDKDKEKEKDFSDNKEKKEQKRNELKSSDRKNSRIIEESKEDSHMKDSSEKSPRSPDNQKQENSFVREESSVDLFELANSVKELSKKEIIAHSPSVKHENHSSRENSKERKYREREKSSGNKDSKKYKEKNRKKHKYKEKHKKYSRSRSHSNERSHKKNKRRNASPKEKHNEETAKKNKSSISVEKFKKTEEITRNISNTSNIINITSTISYNNESPAKITPQKTVRLSTGRVLTKESSTDNGLQYDEKNSEAKLNDLREKIQLKKQIKGSITNRIIKKGNN